MRRSQAMFHDSDGGTCQAMTGNGGAVVSAFLLYRFAGLAVAHAIGTKAHMRIALAVTSCHSFQKLGILFISIGLKVEVARHSAQALIPGAFNISLHKTIVSMPGHADRPH